MSRVKLKETLNFDRHSTRPTISIKYLLNSDVLLLQFEFQGITLTIGKCVGVSISENNGLHQTAFININSILYEQSTRSRLRLDAGFAYQSSVSYSVYIKYQFCSL